MRTQSANSWLGKISKVRKDKESVLKILTFKSQQNGTETLYSRVCNFPRNFAHREIARETKFPDRESREIGNDLCTGRSFTNMAIDLVSSKDHLFNSTELPFKDHMIFKLKSFWLLSVCSEKNVFFCKILKVILY